MKTFSIILSYLLFQNVFCQTVVKQITNFDFNSRNPVFITSDVHNFDPNAEFFFEGEKDTSVNIYSLKYDVSVDSFYQLTQITSNNYINKKPVEKYLYDYGLKIDYKLLLWETNQNGNWDIAYSTNRGNEWLETKFLVDSVEDELDPSFIFQGWFYYHYQNPFQLVFSRGNSIFLFSKDSVQREELVFRGNDTIKYSDPALCVYDSLYAVAVRSINSGDPYLVYKTKGENDTTWSEIKELFKRAPAIKPIFMDLEYGTVLTFEVLFNGKQKVVIKKIEDFGTNNPLMELLNDQSLETSDFNTYEYPIVTKRSDYDLFYPYSFRYVKNDSTFIRSGPFYSWKQGSNGGDFYTKVHDSKSSLGFVGWDYDLITYTIWEDSSKDGRINLYGIKRINPSGDVNNPGKKKLSYKLFQNYPNPFNPTTKIGFQIANPGFVSLKIYDILGREVATLIHEEKQAGEYEVNFDAGKFNLPSGIYFYRLRAGAFLQTKKLILIK